MNNDMKKFISRSIILFLMVSLIFIMMIIFGIFVIGSQYQGNYMASLIDKVARLKSLNEPKIILVGNSNLAFGINSPMIEEAVNMPVVNLGLHAGLGNMFHEDIAKININSGDLVIVCHSNFSDDNIIKDTALAWITVEYHKDLWEIIRPEDYCNMLRAYPVYWWKSFKLWITLDGNKTSDGSYSRSAYNKNGDDIIKDHPLSADKLAKLFSINNHPPKINDTCIDRLNEFNKYITEIGATLLIAGYPIGYVQYKPSTEEFNEFQQKLADKLDCEIISDYKNYFMPYTYFYDTILHLTNDGAVIRSLRLIRDIQKWKEKKYKTGSK